MCGRKTLTKDKREIIKEYNVDQSNWPDSEKYSPSYNIAPTDENPILRFKDERYIQFMQWGLIPFWADDMAIGQKMINARSETLQKKRTYKPLLKNQRCVVIADGFYEWKGKKGNKQPYYFFKPEHRLISFAGLWSHWESNQNKVVNSYTIITTPASQSVEKIHDRMPAILEQDKIDSWLDSGNTVEKALELLKPYQDLEYYPVAKHVNSVQNNSPRCIEKQPQLFS